MAGRTVKGRTRVAVKKMTKKAVKKAVTKKSAPVRRATTTRVKRPSVSVVVLSGSTPLRRSKAAELVAEELQLDLAKVNLSSVVSRYVGETEKNINRVFDEAERSGSILFFDGADALFGTQRAGKGDTGHYADAGAAHLLQRIEAHKGLVILTTNGESRIDQALSRQAQVSLLVGIKTKRRKKTA
ncbi:MAG: AAA family ATPase [Nitrospira defluvii]|nr:AAA family ATPase [Nitrospira defluvii]